MNNPSPYKGILRSLLAPLGKRHITKLHQQDQVLKAQADDLMGQEFPKAIDLFHKAQVNPAKPMLVKFYARVDSLISEFASHTACGAGCDYCCHYRVEVDAAEAFAMIEHVNALPSGTRRLLKQRVIDTARLVSDMTEEQYKRTNIPCAFLVDKKCSVYEVRPMACRSHHATDRGTCERTFINPLEEEINVYNPGYRVATYAMMTVKRSALHHHSADITYYEMHAAIAAGLTDSTARVRWRNGEVVFPDVIKNQKI